MLKCPNCGNIHFEGIKTEQPFECPAAGCGEVIDVRHMRVEIHFAGKTPAVDIWSQPRSGVRPIKPESGLSRLTPVIEGSNTASYMNAQETPVAPRVSPIRFFELESGEMAVAGLKEPLEVLNVPAMWEGRPVTQIRSKAFCGKTCLRKVILPDCLRMIGDNAFEGCTSLESVRLGTRIRQINAGAFHLCTSLAQVEYTTIPDYTDQTAFAGCYSLPAEIEEAFRG